MINAILIFTFEYQNIVGGTYAIATLKTVGVVPLALWVVHVHIIRFLCTTHMELKEQVIDFQMVNGFWGP